MARLYKTNGEVLNVHPENNHDFSLEELQNYVEGDIQIVHLSDNEVLVVNEEGKLHRLPFNENATKVWIKYYGKSDYIVGNALVCNSDEIE